MAKESAPAFQFYPKDFLADANVQAMTLAEIGAYVKLLAICWMEGSLPSDPERLARLLGVPAQVFRKLWPAVSVCFVEEGAGLTHRRLDRERAKQQEFRRAQSVRGSAGASRRWSKHDRIMAAPSFGDGASMAAPSSGDGDPNAQAMLGDSSPISDLQVPPNPPNGGLSGEGTPNRTVPPMPESILADPVLEARAGEFLERWPEVYAKARAGAYAGPIIPRRDWPKALDLVHGCPDVDRLCLMAEVFLKRDAFAPRNIPGTIGQFAHMAPECDRLLREHGR